MKRALFLIITFLAISFLKGAIIQLKDGTTIQGKIIKQDSLKIEIQDERGIIQIIPREKIEKILQDISLTSSFTIDRERIKEAGEYLKKHTNWYYTGVGFQAGGLLFMLLGALYEYAYEEPSVLTYIGSGLYFGGWLTTLVSHYFIYQAGKSLENAIRK